MESNYRIRVEIYDDEVGEVVSKEDQPLLTLDSDNISAAFTALRRFDILKEAHEATYYPKEESETV